MWPRPHSISASRPRGSSPAPSWLSTVAGASRKAGNAIHRNRPSPGHERSLRRAFPVPGRRPVGDRRHRGDAVAGDPRGGGALRRDDPQGTAGPRLRDRTFADGRRGDVSPLWIVSGLPPDRRAVDDLSQPGRGRQRPAPGDVPGKRPGFRPGALAELRDFARRRPAGHFHQRLQRRDDRRGPRGEATGNVGRRPDSPWLTPALRPRGTSRARSSTRSPTSSSTSKHRPATRPSGSTAWRRRWRRCRASRAARSSTSSRPRLPDC